MTHKNISLEISAPKIRIDDKSSLIEKKLVGQKAVFAHHITSRIDHLMTASHTIASVEAIENAYGINASANVRRMRNLLLMLELISSHNEFLYTKIIPRFFGAANIFEFAEKFKKEYNRYVHISKKLNLVLSAVGGKYPHPISVVVGSAAVMPDFDKKEQLIKALKDVRHDVEKTNDIIIKNMTYKAEFDYLNVSLTELDFVPLIGLNMLCNESIIDIKKYYDNYDYTKKIMTGPIARVSNNNKLFEGSAEKVIKKQGLSFPIKNPYLNILCMSIEMLNFLHVGIDLLTNFSCETEEVLKYKPKKSVGHACVESPKGALFYNYHIDEKGIITKARIISNIAQNSALLEESIKKMPIDFDRRTRRQILDEIEFMTDCFYL